MKLSIAEAWNELKGINNQISLLETLQATNGLIKGFSFKEIITSGGKKSNDSMLISILKNDKYSEELLALYKSKVAYETYILEEIERLKVSNPGIVIGFLKEYLKLSWSQISNKVDYSTRQCHRYYDEYRGKTPKENCD